MGEVIYQGKSYYEPSPDAQQALVSAGIFSFRYYPMERLFVATDMMVENTGCQKFYNDMPYTMMEDLILPEDHRLCEELFRRIEQGETRVATTLRRKKDGSLVRITMTRTAKDEQVCPCSAIGIVEYPGEDLEAAELVRALSDDYHSIYYVDFEKNELIPYRISDAIEREYGEMLAKKPSYDAVIRAYIEKTVKPSEQEDMRRLCAVDNLRAFFAENNALIHDYSAIRDGREIYCRMKAVNLSGEKSTSRMILGFSDISREKTKELERYAYTDPVTGGANYRRFKMLLREKTVSGYLVSMDIHSFKVVNSICGTTKGDEILKEIWLCITSKLGEQDLAAHINADRYIIFFAGKDKEAVSEKLELLTIQLNKRSAALNVPQQIPYFGISEWEPERKIEQIYNEANIARQEIKDRKDINHAFFSKDDVTRMLQEKQMEDAFEESIRNKSFEIWYQPKYSPQQRELVGAEALVRWRNKDGTLVSPGVFIPLFERNGMIRYLDEYVFRNVCMLQKRWQDDGREMFPISVNLSRASLYFQNVVERYKRITEEIGIDPRLVPIEITETAAIDNKSIRQLADNFCAAGFPLHMDDFGAGYSSFATLNVMHFDTLKLDKSLIDYIGNYGGDRLLEHTIALAKDLGMHVTAEGVETEQQVDFLQKLNCDSIQGFYFSRPLPPDQFEEMCAE